MQNAEDTNRNVRHAPGHRRRESCCLSLDAPPPLFLAARLHLHCDEVALVPANLVAVVLVVVVIVVVPPVVGDAGDDAARGDDTS